MTNNVVLFLTSPSSLKRTQVALENFKQLEKMGFDIITLSTTDFLPDYICERSKFVLYDYKPQSCHSTDYYNYFKKTGFGYFFSLNNISHTVFLFQKTHFPSLLRNTRTLIHLAKVFDYNNYFFVEDDHFFHDDDLSIIKNYFDKLENNDLIVHSFDRNGGDGDMVYCTYFHFGKTNSMNNIAKNFAYNEKEYLKKDPNIYLHFYEYTFKSIINSNKPVDFKILEVNDIPSNIYKNSVINIYYSFKNLDDDVRCNFIYDTINKNPIFFYHTVGVKNTTNIKIFIDEKLQYTVDLNSSNWYSVYIPPDSIKNTTVIINDKIKKTFNHLVINDIIYNGEIVQ